MIHKIKTVTYEVRSHSFITVLSESGKVVEQPRVHDWAKSFDLKRLIGHLYDVLGRSVGWRKKRQKKQEMEA